MPVEYKHAQMNESEYMAYLRRCLLSQDSSHDGSHDTRQQYHYLSHRIIILSAIISCELKNDLLRLFAHT